MQGTVLWDTKEGLMQNLNKGDKDECSLHVEMEGRSRPSKHKEWEVRSRTKSCGWCHSVQLPSGHVHQERATIPEGQVRG